MSDMKFSKDHVWVKLDNGVALVGITDHAQNEFGDILFVDLPEEGKSFNKGEAFTEIESAKAAVEVILPFSGEVLEANEELDDSPELINESPYENWIAKLKVNDLSELDDLMTKEEYEAGL